MAIKSLTALFTKLTILLKHQSIRNHYNILNKWFDIQVSFTYT